MDTSNITNVTTRNQMDEGEVDSGTLEDEMRLQPLKNASARKLNDILKASLEHLDTMTRNFKANENILWETNYSSINTENELNMKLIQMKELHLKEVQHLEEKAKILEMHNVKMEQIFNKSKQDSDVLIRDMKDELKVTSQKKEELQTIVCELSKNNEDQNCILQEKNKEMQILKNHQKQQVDKFNKQYNNLHNIKLQMQKNVKQSNDAKEYLQKALDSQVEINKTICLERDQLQNKLVILEKENNTLKAEVDELKIKLHESQQTVIYGLDKEMIITQNQLLTRDCTPPGVTTPSHVTQHDNAVIYSSPLFEIEDQPQIMEQGDTSNHTPDSLNIYRIDNCNDGDDFLHNFIDDNDDLDDHQQQIPLPVA